MYLKCVMFFKLYIIKSCRWNIWLCGTKAVNFINQINLERSNYNFLVIALIFLFLQVLKQRNCNLWNSRIPLWMNFYMKIKASFSSLFCIWIIISLTYFELRNIHLTKWRFWNNWLCIKIDSNFIIIFSSCNFWLY